MSEPAFLTPERVEQSTLDDLYERGVPAPPVRLVRATVVTVDSPGECTVLMLDEEVPGVGYSAPVSPQPGDVVDVEMVGDLVTVRAVVPDPDSATLVAGHIVSDTQPDPPAPEQVPVSGSLREPDDWLTTGWDTVTWLNPGLAVEKAAATGDATLDSLVPFEVAAGDTVTVTVTEDAITSYDLHVTLALTDDPDADLGDYNTTTGGYTDESGVPESGEGHYERIMFTVPTTASGPDGDPPVQGLLLLRFESLATSGVPLTFHSVEVVRQRSEYPVGTLWLNPAHTAHPVAFHWSSMPATASSITATAQTPIPGSNIKRIRFPATGSVLLWLRNTANSTGTASFNLRTVVGMAVVEGAAEDTSNTVARWQPTTVTTNDWTTLSTFARLRITEPGTVLDISNDAWVASGEGGRCRIQWGTVMALYMPGAVEADADATEIEMRYWNGTEWSYGPPVTTETYTAGGTPGYTPTTTSLAKSGATLTATVSPSAATGSVQFKKGSNVVATKSLSGGKASYTATESGTYTAKYLGNASYSGSESGSKTVTVTKVVTKTLTQNAKWVQAYRGDGAQLSGSSCDSCWNQGYADGFQGNRRTLLGYKRVQDLGGFSGTLVEVTKVRLRLSNTHSWNGNGMDLDLGWHQNTGGSAPGSFPGSTHPNESSHFLDRGQANQWSNITSWAKSKVDNSNFGGILIGGPGADNNAHYGYGPGGNNQCILEITAKMEVEV